MSAMFKHYNIPLVFHFLFNESLIPRARNYCCDEFMRMTINVQNQEGVEVEKRPFGHMMFIDADIGFNPQDVLALMALQNMEGNDYDIVGGPYPKKCISWEKIKTAVDKGFADKDPQTLEKFVGDYVFNPKGGTGNILISEPAEVLEIGTGFMMMKREAMDKFCESYPQYFYRPDHVRTQHFDGSRPIMQFFQAEMDVPDPLELKNQIEEYLQFPVGSDAPESSVGSVIYDMIKNFNMRREASTKRYLSEDYWFCQKAHAIGLKTWLCPWMQMSHVGTYIFGGSLADLAAIGAAATADPSKLNKLPVPDKIDSAAVPSKQQEKLARRAKKNKKSAGLAT
jgi:hypothetical protein